jgi:hypothetical protein
VRNAISVFRLGRSFIHGPLAVILLSLLPPMLPSLPDGMGPRLFQAAAENTNNRIFQNCLGPICADLIQLEDDAVKGYLQLHRIPLEDAHVIYALGRADLRSEIRAYMFNILITIISTVPAARTPHRQRLYDWFLGLVHQNEIAQYTVAYDEFLKWKNNPCLFTLDDDIASQYGLSYSGAPGVSDRRATCSAARRFPRRAISRHTGSNTRTALRYRRTPISRRWWRR